MAITTQNGLSQALGTSKQHIFINKASVTAVSGRTLSMWSAAGTPTVGSTTLGQAAAGVVPTSASTGAPNFINAGSGNLYLAGMKGISGGTGSLFLYDILWVWGSGGSGWSVTTNGVQSTTTPAALTRPDSLGVGTELWVECLAAGGASSGTSTVTYTNSASVGSRTATLRDGAPISSPPIGTMQPYTMTAGDTGYQSIQSINNSSSWSSGTFRLMIVKRIAEIPTVGSTPFTYDALDLGMPLISPNACLGLGFHSNASAVTGPFSASITLVQG